MKVALILPAVIGMLDSGMSASGQIPGFPDGRPLQMSPTSPTPSRPTPTPSKPIPNEPIIDRQHHLRRHHPAGRTRPGLQSATVTFAAPPQSGTIRNKSSSTKYRFSTDSSGNTVYRDNSGRRVFSIEKSGTVRDSSGRREGQFTTDSMGTTTFRDNSGRTKHRIQKNGDIRESSGRLMGKIEKR
jgi:hypothetical protein